MKNFKLVLLILVCFGISACSNSSNNHKQPIHTGSDILKTFGDEDLIRMKEFVDRFNNKKSDYVLAIPPFLDGGYSIYDLISDGKLVTIKRDSTRDIYGGSKSTFTCKAMKIQEEGDEQQLVLGSCEAEEGSVAEVKLFTFNGDL
ncbi:DUF4362 domain-containing protein [Bacillus sp. FJAT-28004]|uniref:DUF4362 domain-containing protein n=1 Tax=Bacillus sp. FJAT-28004 TaxID=1679165 RepID=UPI0006B5D048|nr:DUF4362 domain-containing protein [Bacillus sp. FJAT-28004]